MFERSENEVSIFTDGGRLVRPVFKVINNEITFPTGKYNWDDLFINHLKFPYI